MFTVVVVDVPSPNFHRYEVKVPEPPVAVAVKLTWIPTSVGFGLAVMLTLRAPTGLMVSVVLWDALVTPIESVALTFTVKVCDVVPVIV